jgi:hypothetical protein
MHNMTTSVPTSKKLIEESEYESIDSKDMSSSGEDSAKGSPVESVKQHLVDKSIFSSKINNAQQNLFSFQDNVATASHPSLKMLTALFQ